MKSKISILKKSCPKILIFSELKIHKIAKFLTQIQLKNIRKNRNFLVASSIWFELQIELQIGPFLGHINAAAVLQNPH